MLRAYDETPRTPCQCDVQILGGEVVGVKDDRNLGFEPLQQKCAANCTLGKLAPDVPVALADTDGGGSEMASGDRPKTG